MEASPARHTGPVFVDAGYTVQQRLTRRGIFSLDMELKTIEDIRELLIHVHQ